MSLTRSPSSRIVGYLDAVTGQGLSGWIANLDQTERLEPVFCCGQDGSKRVFLPFIPRHDVCEAYGIKGRFGFAIPLSLLHGLGRKVTLEDARGARLHDAVNIQLPPIIPDVPGVCRVVVHIQKTAGTSLRTALTGSIPPGRALFLYPDRFIGLSPAELATFPIEQRAALRLVMGHVYFGIGNLLPGPTEYITFLREPEARLRSHYLHHLAARSSLLGGNSEREVSRMVNEGATDEFDNLMVRMIAGTGEYVTPIGGINEAHVDLAIHNIRTSFRFVGIVERMSDHYPALCQFLHFPKMEMQVENISRIKRPATVLGNVDWPKVMHRNRFDVMLYKRVQIEGLAGWDIAQLRSAVTQPVITRLGGVRTSVTLDG